MCGSIFLRLYVDNNYSHVTVYDIQNAHYSFLEGSFLCFRLLYVGAVKKERKRWFCRDEKSQTKLVTDILWRHHKKTV